MFYNFSFSKLAKSALPYISTGAYVMHLIGLSMVAQKMSRADAAPISDDYYKLRDQQEVDPTTGIGHKFLCSFFSIVWNSTHPGLHIQNFAWNGNGCEEILVKNCTLTGSHVSLFASRMEECDGPTTAAAFNPNDPDSPYALSEQYMENRH